MSFEDVSKQLNPEIYRRFKLALEIGKWPDGRTLTKAQKELCLQSVMVYEAEHNIPEAERVGYIDREKKKLKDNSTDNPDDDLQSIDLRTLH